MPVLAVPVGEKWRAEVKLSSPFDRRYAGIDTWKTVEARGGGVRHILLPHLCDYVLQLVRRWGDHLDGIDLALDVDARGTSERFDVTVRGPGSHVVACSTPTQTNPCDDTFQRLFERSLHSLAVAVVSGADDASDRPIDTIPIADVDDLILAYRLIEVLEDRQGRRRQPRRAWRLDGDDIAELSAWIASNKRSTERPSSPGSVVVRPA